MAKEGGFVVISSGLYNEKALSAVKENFRPAQIDPRKAKREALKACQGEALSNLASSVRKADGLGLQAFFTAKTHKEGTPFRVIVSERGSWQRVLGKFLQKSLSQLKIDDPFLVRSPTDVSDYLQRQCPAHVYGFSLDIKDLYYSLPHSELMEVVSEGIDHYGSVRFQSASGVDTNTFLDLLGLYLRSSLVEFNSEFFVQREGVCIGSCLAPMLSDLLLARHGRQLEVMLRASKTMRVFRYVDDFLVLFECVRGDVDEHVQRITDIFETTLAGLTLTRELPSDNELRFLDLLLHFRPSHVCWRYAPRSKKSLLPFSSGHSKIVKRAIAFAALRSSFKRSCPDEAEASFNAQVAGLESAGFPHALLRDLAEVLLRQFRKGSEAGPLKDRPAKIAVVPYMHGVPHMLKKVAGRAGVGVVFSAPQKLGGLCRRVNINEPKGTCCEKRHTKVYVECRCSVVYEVPLSCGKTYIGQTGRCLNDRPGEHENTLKTCTGSNLATHCQEHGCSLRFDATRLARTYKGSIG